jgi:N utilization substance protein B
VIIPDVFQNEDDKAYAKKLLTQSLVKYEEYTKLIAEHVSNWDMERLVATDLALIVMGITEAVTFETIPLKVTINEFVDISKYYSTANSRIFVNGLLDKMLQKMYREGQIVKTGRGLVGSPE